MTPRKAPDVYAKEASSRLFNQLWFHVGLAHSFANNSPPEFLGSWTLDVWALNSPSEFLDFKKQDPLFEANLPWPPHVRVSGSLRLT